MSQNQAMDNYSSSFFLGKHFSQFEPALKEKIAANASLREFSAGEQIMQTGQYFRSTVLIAEGRVKLYREGAAGEEFFIYYLEPGQACALSMICATRQETSQIMAKAIEPTIVLTIPIQLMDDLMREHKTWYYFVLDSYRSRFEELLTVVDNVIFKSMDERLEYYLKRQCEKLQTKQLRITHQEIANDLNSSREVISRLLKKLEQNRQISLFRNYIECHF
ncbi:Crp/Fnr family transcriptional regulator [Pararcticibacter amylolyticus]|nr:Crp/Fnr family transcriptional regulator [Pararcticibacter amylolyticus]